MKYLVIGAGGTGGGIAGYMAAAGKDVTVIARGEHLKAMCENGLYIKRPGEDLVLSKDSFKACTMEDYADTPDVIFVCVKGYSIDDCIPFIKKVAKDDTVVIPILNIYGTGKKLQERLKVEQDWNGLVTDGCIYIAAQIDGPGKILMLGQIFKVVYGFRKDTTDEIREKYTPVLKEIEKDLADSDITPVLSEQIEKDALQKFSFVSPMAASGAHFDLPSEPFQKPGMYRDTFIKLIGEVKALSDAMGVSLPDNIVEINLKILDDLAPTSSTSMHRDIKAGKQSEFDGLVMEVIRLGKQYNIPTPGYEEMAQ